MASFPADSEPSDAILRALEFDSQRPDVDEQRSPQSTDGEQRPVQLTDGEQHPVQLTDDGRFATAASSSAPSEVGTVREGVLTLSDGRSLHYQECGDLSGRGFPTFVFHGALGVGDFQRFADVFQRLGRHCICPTLPGWGESSPKRERQLLDWSLDVLELARHAGIASHQNFDVAGISLGATHAMACAATISDRIRKTLVVGGMAPFTDDAFDALAGMDTLQGVQLSGFSAALPALSKLSAWTVKRSVQGDDAVRFVNEQLIDKLSPEERRQFADMPDHLRDTFVPALARGIQQSLQHHFTGFAELPRLLRTWHASDLARVPDAGAAVMIVAARSDVIVPYSHAQYLSQKLPAAAFVTIPGGHMSLVFAFPQLFERFAEWTPGDHDADDAERSRFLQTQKPIVADSFDMDGPQLPDYVSASHAKPTASLPVPDAGVQLRSPSSSSSSVDQQSAPTEAAT